MDFNVNVFVSIYEESLMKYLNSIDNVTEIDTLELEKMVFSEVSNEINKGDLSISSMWVTNSSGDLMDFPTWFDSKYKNKTSEQ